MTHQSRRCHILVAVEPPLLGELLARVVVDAGVGEVTVARAGRGKGREILDVRDSSRVYDVALVTSGPGPRTPAVTMIRLPDDTGSAGLASVDGPQGRRAVMLHGLGDLLALLEELCPAGERRAVQVTAH